MLRHGTALLGLLVFLLVASPATAKRTHHCRKRTPRHFAYCLTMKTWHSLSQWRALDAVVTPESSWDPCAHYPSTHDCFYRGANSCGIPQRNPCPYQWRGRLFTTRFLQVKVLLAYVKGRYGDPLHAYWFRSRNGWY